MPKDNEINSKQFDWSFEIRVPGGGLVWDESDLNFEAPKDGYKESIGFQYTKSMPVEEWQRQRNGRYFMKFADGTHGRIHFNIDGASDRRPLYLESWFNPKPDSRNLATDKWIINVMESKESER